MRHLLSCLRNYLYSYKSDGCIKVLKVLSIPVYKSVGDISLVKIGRLSLYRRIRSRCWILGVPYELHN